MKKLHFTILAAGALLLGGLGLTAVAQQSAVAGVAAPAKVAPGDPAEVHPQFSMVEGAPVITFTVTAPTKTQYDWSANPPETDLAETDLMTLTVVRKSDEGPGANQPRTIATFTDVKPGETLDVTDTQDITIGVKYFYNVIATIDGNSSSDYGGSGSVYAGIEIATPSDFTATSTDGFAPVKISLVAPSTDTQDRPLEYHLISIVLSRQNMKTYDPAEDIHTWENPEFGQPLTYTDNDVEEGVSYRYFAVVKNEMGSSYSSSTGEIYIGEDSPNAPENVEAVLTDAGAKVTWDQVSDKGQNNGFVDVDKVVYDVYRRYSYDDKVLVAEGLSVCNYIDEVDNLDAPAKLSWQVRARNSMGTSSENSGISNEIICGPALPLPFVEKFDTDISEYSVKANNLWEAKAITGYSTFYPSTYAYINGEYVHGADYSEGQFDGLAYVDFSAYSFGTSTYTSGAINTGEKKNLVAGFDYYGVENSVSQLNFNVLNPDNEASVAEPLNLLNINIGEGETGWISTAIAIPFERRRTKIAIQFEAVTEDNNENNTPVAIDNIFLREYPGVKNMTGAAAGEYVKLSWVDPTPDYATFKEFRIYQLNPKAFDYELIGTSEERPTYLVGPLTEEGTYLFRVEVVYDINGFIFAAEPTEEWFFDYNGVETINAEDIVSEEYFNLQGAAIEAPAEGQVVIRKVVLTNGTVKAIKTVYKK